MEKIKSCIILIGLVLAMVFATSLNSYAARNINQSPNPPTITGPPLDKTYAGSSYTYSFSSTDPDGDNVCYWIEWGDGTIYADGWTGFYPSGATLSVAHIWEEQGTYEIKAKAKDTHDAESEWAYLTVIMPVSLEVGQQQTVPQSQPSGQQQTVK